MFKLLTLHHCVVCGHPKPNQRCIKCNASYPAWKPITHDIFYTYMLNKLRSSGQ